MSQTIQACGLGFAVLGLEKLRDVFRMSTACKKETTVLKSFQSSIAVIPKPQNCLLRRGLNVTPFPYGYWSPNPRSQPCTLNRCTAFVALLADPCHPHKHDAPDLQVF